MSHFLSRAAGGFRGQKRLLGGKTQSIAGTPFQASSSLSRARSFAASEVRSVVAALRAVEGQMVSRPPLSS